MDFCQDLNTEQKKAVQHEKGPLLIVAGAGTGKTTVITRKIAHLLVDKKINPDKVLALTFTEKSAAEMSDRVEALLPFGFLDLWVSTFHAFGERILRENALNIGLTTNFKLLSSSEQWLLVQRNLEQFNLDYYQPKGNPTKFIEALLKHFSRLKDEDISPAQYLDFAKNLQLDNDSSEEEKTLEIKRINELANAYHIYQNLMLQNNAFDFGDLISYTVKLFKEKPNILKKYQKQFQYILVDEFQDTNYAQYDLIKLLAAKHQNLTVVGDDDQAIYKFRGASISNILEFKKDYPSAKEIVLVENYRSSQNILDLAHKFIIHNNPNRLEERLRISKKLHSQAPDPGLIEHLTYKTLDAEVAGVIKKITQLKNKKNHWNDFAILIRANSQAEQFMPYLERNEIPYQFLASKGLFTKPLVIDLLSYLKLLDNYHESRAMYRVLNFEIFKLTPDDIIVLLNYARRKSISLYETMQQYQLISGISKSAAAQINIILSLIQKHTNLAIEKSVGQVLLDFLQVSGYLKQITNKDSLKFREKVLHLNQFYKHIQKFEQSTLDKTVRNFIQEINLYEEAGETGSLQPDFEEGPDTLKIMTVHSAKGLEFDYVFMVNLVDKRFPAIEKSEPIPIDDKLIKEIIPIGDVHLEEERRLFYVGMTRAKKGLFFTSAEDYGGVRKKKISRFLIEAGLAKEIKVKPSGKTEFTQKIVETCHGLPAQTGTSLQYKYLPEQKFSFTQLKAFETCPWQYRFAHILKIPVPGKASLSFGKTMHATLYNFFKIILDQENNQQADLFGEKKPVETIHELSLQNLLKIYDTCWIDDWYYSKKNKDEYYKKGKEILKQFYKLHEKQWPKIKYLEKAFNLKIDKFNFKGAIDRIDAVDGGVEIVDYKTGKIPKDKKNNEQLYIYAIAIKEILKQEPVKATFYYLEDNKSISFIIEEKELNKIRTWVLDMINLIIQGNFAAKPGFHCQFCDFSSICEYRK